MSLLRHGCQLRKDNFHSEHLGRFRGKLAHGCVHGNNSRGVPTESKWQTDKEPENEVAYI